MAIITDPKEAHFLFIVDTDTSINERKFDVVEFFGEEAISQLYQFNITLASEDQNISFSDVIHQPATFYLKVNDVQGDIVTSKREIPGIVSDLQYIGMDGPGRYHYEATFVPHHWYLNLYLQSRVFQNNTITQIIQEVLRSAEVDHDAYSIFSSDKANNSVRDYCVQYCETDLDFIHRIKEFEGIYYYFEKGTEKMTFIDSSVNEPNVLDPLSIYFEDGSGIDMDQMDAIDNLVYRERAIPERVVLKDYHYEFPTDNMEAEKALDNPRGLYYDHGQTLKDTPVPKDNNKSEQELRQEAKNNKQTRINELAEIRQEEIECRRRILTGRSNCVELLSGYRIELNEAKDNTLRTDLKDNTFLITQVKHVGTQAMLIHGSPSRLLAKHGYPETTAGYFNTFTSIPGDVQYRPPRVTPVPKIPGIMTAKVESDERDKTKADIDEQGRYVVRMPFDRRETDTAGEGAATRVLRMAQPYSGKHYGIHFPNHKDTEMVFAFINGDIDRPLGLSTVPHWDTHTPVPSKKNKLSSQNSWAGGIGATWEGSDVMETVTFEPEKNVIKTHVGHQLVMDDADGTSNVGITIQCGKSKIPGGTGDPYWSTRIDMGGYRKKTLFEQLLDSASHVFSMIDSVLLKRIDLPAMTSVVAQIVASQVLTGNYLSDTFGTTTGVGIKGVTNYSVDFQGMNGINLKMPNILGIWGGGLIPGKEAAIGDKALRAIVDFLVNSLYKNVLKNLYDEYSTYKKHKADPDWSELRAFFNWEKNKTLARTNSVFMSALGLPAINLKSAAGINLAAWSKVTVVGGYDGISLISKSNMKQTSDLDFNIEAGQGIVIKAKGEPNGSPGFLSVIPNMLKNFKIPVPGLGATISSKLGMPPPDPEDCKITILNENQDIHVLAKEGNILNKANGHISQISNKGNITVKAHDGNINLMNKNVGVHLLGGSGPGSKSTLNIVSFGRIALSAGGGKASITLNPDGEIVLSGTKITINGEDETLIKGGKSIDLQSQKATISASMMAPVPAPMEPTPPDYEMLPGPPVILPPQLPKTGDPMEAKTLAIINSVIVETNAKNQKEHAERMLKYETYMKQLELYHKQHAIWAAQKGVSTAQIQLASGSVTADAQLNYNVNCTNYASEAKGIMDLKGTIVNADAKGVLNAKGALTKIG